MSYLFIKTSPSSHDITMHSTESNSSLDESIQPSEEPVNSNMSPTIEHIEEDSLYCMRSTFVFFQVERRLFCVPTYRFVDESDAFTKLFKLPEPNVCGVKGSSREDPIILPDISHKDFHNFLKALYPLTVSAELKLRKAEWISVLRLSTLWYFLKYRKIAISKFEVVKKLSATEKVVYGREFRIRRWIEEGCEEIVREDTMISKESGGMLGFDMVFCLFTLRESRIRGSMAVGGDDVGMMVREALKEELGCVARSELEYRMDDGDDEEGGSPLSEGKVVVVGAEEDRESGCEDGKAEKREDSPVGNDHLTIPVSTFNFVPPSVVAIVNSEPGRKKNRKRIGRAVRR